MSKAVLMMAAGTGGHVFPALAVADELCGRGVTVHWLGTPNGMENELVKKRGYAFHAIDMKGVRGNGVMRLLKMPLMVLTAIQCAKKIIKDNHIDVSVGFGGYVTVPGGLATKLCQRPLLIHEQNAVAGMSNQKLARFATTIMQAFDGALAGDNAVTVGNPVRADILAIAPPNKRYDINDNSPLKVLVMGGSLGAMAINEAMVAIAKDLNAPKRLCIRHQCGRGNFEQIQALYADFKSVHTIELLPFIEDMAEAYGWADVVVCRSGALTVTEIQTVGIAAIFIPLPHAVDDHQTKNAQVLVDDNGAFLLPQSRLDKDTLAPMLYALDRKRCLAMAQNAQKRAKKDAAEKVAGLILKAIE